MISSLVLICRPNYKFNDGKLGKGRGISSLISVILSLGLLITPYFSPSNIYRIQYYEDEMTDASVNYISWNIGSSISINNLASYSDIYDTCDFSDLKWTLLVYESYSLELSNIYSFSFSIIPSLVNLYIHGVTIILEDIIFPSQLSPTNLLPDYKKSIPSTNTVSFGDSLTFDFPSDLEEDKQYIFVAVPLINSDQNDDGSYNLSHVAPCILHGDYDIGYEIESGSAIDALPFYLCTKGSGSSCV
ncbi:hypothetical protein ADUPG1_014032 [Aduncisulcus paluster]|uniref:Uncharacterized protein n=1 Tax=Aduncisulcus paluster TaxID=2918883 RepID=A0ABQ5K887_9EUKA|nr:hypothetical protein ADUPG1_014032 [Aduncisulcus paluster]